MKPHVKIYLESVGLNPGEHIPCEICYALDPELEGAPAVDIHHIDARGMGGSKTANDPDNLMALCRAHHTDFGDIAELKPYLQTIHNNYLKNQKS